MAPMPRGRAPGHRPAAAIVATGTNNPPGHPHHNASGLRHETCRSLGPRRGGPSPWICASGIHEGNVQHGKAVRHSNLSEAAGPQTVTPAIHFSKYQALGNSYLVLPALPEAVAVEQGLVPYLCDWRIGIGGD